jgi:hypothetical protein
MIATTFRAQSLGSSTKSSDAVTVPPGDPGANDVIERPPNSFAAPARVMRRLACGIRIHRSGIAASATTSTATARSRGRRLRRRDRNVQRGPLPVVQRIEVYHRNGDGIREARRCCGAKTTTTAAGTAASRRRHRSAWQQHHEFASRLRRRDLVRGVAVDTAEDHRYGADRPRRARAGDRDEILLPRERISVDREARMIREPLRVEGQHLEVRAVVAGKDQAEPSDLGRDVRGSLPVADAADLAAEHRIISKLI